MEPLVLISSDLKLGSPDFFLWCLPKVKMMLLSALLLIWVWGAYSEAPSVKRFFGARRKKRQMSS